MKQNKKGISLIVLVITIIVIIILAAAVILTLTANNPINSANAAKIAQNKDSIESALNLYVAQKVAATKGEYTNAQILSDAGITEVTAAVVGSASTDANIVGYCPLVTTGTTFLDNVGITLPSAGTGAWYVDPATNKVYVVYPHNGIPNTTIGAMTEFVKEFAVNP